MSEERRSLSFGMVMANDLSLDVLARAAEDMTAVLGEGLQTDLLVTSWDRRKKPNSARRPTHVPYGELERTLPADAMGFRTVLLDRSSDEGPSSKIVDVQAFLARRGLSRLTGGVVLDGLPLPDTEALSALTSSFLDLARLVKPVTGYVTYDFMSGLGSPYEAAVGLNLTRTRWDKFLCGYYWGNLLSASHYADLLEYGTPGLTEVFTVTELDDMFWLQSTDPFPSCDTAKLDRMRTVLGPLLVEGIYGTIEDHREAGGPHQRCL